MDLDDLAVAIAEGAAEGFASSVPLPPRPGQEWFPPLPPPPPGGPEGGGPPPPPERPREERRPVVPIVVAIALTVLVGVGAFALVSWARGGAPCEEGDFRSARFGYCVRTPSGWVAAAAESEGTALDRFLLPDGAATITVTAVPLTKGQDLARFEQFVRGYDEQAGGTPGESSPREVGGVDALTFDVTLEGPDAVTRSREVLFVRDGIAWRVTLADEETSFEASTRQLDEMLGTWRFT
jgi:hypothetical protein